LRRFFLAGKLVKDIHKFVSDHGLKVTSKRKANLQHFAASEQNLAVAPSKEASKQEVIITT